MVMLESSQWLGKNIVLWTDFKNLGHDITEMLLKTVVNTIQSVSLYVFIFAKKDDSKFIPRQFFIYLNSEIDVNMYVVSSSNQVDTNYK